MTRRWEAGMFGEVAGFRYRVRPGVKHADDLVMEMLIEGYWIAIPMALGFLLSDFFFENEQVLYPPPRYRGGMKYVDACKHAGLHGWQKAVAGLRAEKDAKSARLFDVEREAS